jgi:hypothetical protein
MNNSDKTERTESSKKKEGPCWKCGEVTDNIVLCCNTPVCPICHFRLLLRIVDCIHCGKRLIEDKAFKSKNNPELSPSLILYAEGNFPDYKLADDQWYKEKDAEEERKNNNE